MPKKTEIIAEVKTLSPFGFKADKKWDELFALAEKIGDIISIHTDPRWGGSFELVKRARGMTTKPILAKGIHADDAHIRKALDAGADMVLVVGRVPSVFLDKCLIEPNTLEELAELPKGTRAVWNARDLATGRSKKETFREAREVWDGWLCQASFIESVDDIEEGADAVLVGSRLQEFGQSLN